MVSAHTGEHFLMDAAIQVLNDFALGHDYTLELPFHYCFGSGLLLAAAASDAAAVLFAVVVAAAADAAAVAADADLAVAAASYCVCYLSVGLQKQIAQVPNPVACLLQYLDIWHCYKSLQYIIIHALLLCNNVILVTMALVH